jgi:ferredoxin
MRVTVDSTRCLGASHCVSVAPEVFDQENDAFVALRRQPSASEYADVRQAAYLCPSGAIQIDAAEPNQKVGTVANALSRRLSFYESLFAAMAINVAATATTRGNLDRAVLAEAYAELVAAQPTLGCVIEQDEQGLLLRTIDGDPPVLEVVDDPLDDVLQTKLPFGGPVARAWLLPGDGGDTVVLLLNHTICDGRSATTLMSTLLRAYTAIATGRRPDLVRETGLPAPVEERLGEPFDDEDIAEFVATTAEKFAGLQPAVMPSLIAFGEAGPDEISGFAVETVSLDTKETARLYEVAKSVGMSVHALLCGAMLAGLSGLLEPDKEQTFVCLSSVNMRPRLRPPLGSQTMILAAAGVQTVIHAKPGADTLALGHEVYQDVTGAIQRGDLERATQALPQLITSTAVPISLGVFNVGWLTLPELPDGLELTSLRGLPIVAGPTLAAGAVVVRGCLQIEFPYSTAFFSADQMKALTESIGDKLRELVADS